MAKAADTEKKNGDIRTADEKPTIQKADETGTPKGTKAPKTSEAPKNPESPEAMRASESPKTSESPKGTESSKAGKSRGGKSPVASWKAEPADQARIQQAAKWQNWVTMCMGLVLFVLSLIPQMVSNKTLGIVFGLVLIAVGAWAAARPSRVNEIALLVLSALLLLFGFLPHMLGTTGWLMGVIVLILSLWYLYENRGFDPVRTR